MKIGIIINDFSSIEVTQSSWLIGRRLHNRGHQVYWYAAWELGLTPAGDVSGAGALVSDELPTEAAARLGPRLLRELDLVFIRTNPGREQRSAVTDTALLLLDRLSRQGTRVINEPRGLWRASSKLYLAELAPSLRPNTLVTRRREEARDFVDGVGRSVMKPLVGTQGRDVFAVSDASDPNFNQIFEAIERHGPVMVQAFVPEGSSGDTRVLVLDGTVLTVDGEHCAIRRVPGGTDFRSNVHVGGRPLPAALTSQQLSALEQVASALKRDGIALAGIDMIGDLVVEVNVFSPGGFTDAEKHTGADFIGALLDWLERAAG